MLSFLLSAVERNIFNLELMTSILKFPKEERNKLSNRFMKPVILFSQDDSEKIEWGR